MTIKEIAKLAEVSISTVSKIVNNKDAGINPQTRERVLKIVKEYHYSPYSSALKANTGKSFLIGILLKSPMQTAGVLRGMMEEAQLHGYHLIPCYSNNDREEELKHIAALCNTNIDGVIWEPVDTQSLGCESHFAEAGIPILDVGYLKPASLHIDFSLLGYELTKQLIGHEHTKIICLKDSHVNSTFIVEGFKKCLFDQEISFSDSVLDSSDKGILYDKIRRHETTAVICACFDDAVELYETLKNWQYRIPHDFSIVSLRDTPAEHSIWPRISFAPIPFHEFGKYLCARIIYECEHEAVSTKNFQPAFYLENTYTLDRPNLYKYPQIVVAGSINLDTYLNVDKLPEFGKTVTTTQYSVFPGGKGTNQAIGASRLGHRVSIIGMVGHDAEADTIYASLYDNKIETAGIKRNDKFSTGHAYIYVQPDGDSMISILEGANSALTSKDIFDQRNLFEHAGYLLIQTEIPLGCVKAACRLARSHGAKTILKPSTLHDIDDELLSLIDIMVPNEAELNELCPKSGGMEDKANWLIQRGLSSVIVTLGSRGCFFLNSESSQYYSAPLFTSVDRTGASDAFISALASYLLYGYSLDASIQIASYAAGFCISRQGVVPSLIDKNTLEASISRLNSSLLLRDVN